MLDDRIRARILNDHNKLTADGKLLSRSQLDACFRTFRSRQEDLDRIAPTVGDLGWGHKYFSLLAPERLDDYHNADYQRFHLVKMLQVPPEVDGRYLCAGRYVAAAHELGIPINHLTTT